MWQGGSSATLDGSERDHGALASLPTRLPKALRGRATGPLDRRDVANGRPPRGPERVEGRMDWRHRAACRDEDPELFFPIGNTGPALMQIEEARAVCHRCEVVDECLKGALETGQDAGVWGGLSEDERRALKRRNARARARAH